MNPFISSENNKREYESNEPILSKKENKRCSKAFARYKRLSVVMAKELEKEKEVKNSEKIKDMAVWLEGQLKSDKKDTKINEISNNEKRNTVIIPSYDILMMRGTFGKNNNNKKKISKPSFICVK